MHLVEPTTIASGPPGVPVESNYFYDSEYRNGRLIYNRMIILLILSFWSWQVIDPGSDDGLSH